MPTKTLFEITILAVFIDRVSKPQKRQKSDNSVCGYIKNEKFQTIQISDKGLSEISMAYNSDLDVDGEQGNMCQKSMFQSQSFYL